MQEITENGVNGNISQKIQDGLAVDLAAQEEGSWMPVEENKEQSEEGGTFASEEIAALEKENASLRASFEPLYAEIGDRKSVV